MERQANNGLSRREYADWKDGWQRVCQPCPFCGNKNIALYHASYGNHWQHRAYCAQCDRRGPLAKSLPEACKAWNSQKWRRGACGDIWADTSIGLALREMKAICARLDRVQEIVDLIQVDNEN